MLKGQIIFDKTLEAQNRRMIIDLAGKLPKTGRCSLLLSGGDTPQSFYNALSQQNWPWEKITTALVDDRWVDPNNLASNENLVKRNLLINHAKKSPFFGMKSSSSSPLLAEVSRNRIYQTLPRPLFAILGMGVDGHIASWFAEDERFNTLSAYLKNNLIASTSLKRKGLADPYRHRMTITGAMLSEVNSAFLIIHGERKYNLLTKAICNGALDLPINRGLELLGPKLRIYALDWKNGDI